MKDAIKGLIEKLVSLIERDWEEYEEVRCIMNRADIQNYFDFELYEDIKYF